MQRQKILRNSTTLANNLYVPQQAQHPLPQSTAIPAAIPVCPITIRSLKFKSLRPSLQNARNSFQPAPKHLPLFLGITSAGPPQHGEDLHCTGCRHHRPAPWESLVRALDFNLSANRIGALAIRAQIDEIRAQNRGA